MTTAPHKKIARFLRAGKRFLIVCHPSPDGDMLGSSVALSLALKKCGKQTVIYSKDALDETYGALPRMNMVTHKKPQGNFDAVITIDCGDLQRLIPYYGEWLKTTKIINIDHHKSNSCFGDYVFVDTKYAAVGEQIYFIIKALGVPLDKDTAFHLYLSIMTDTGNFRFSNTTALTFNIAAELVKCGINPEDVYSRVYESRSAGRFKLLIHSLQKLKLHENGRIAVIVITQEMLKKAGVKDPETQDILDIVRTLKSVKMSLLLKERSRQEIKVSLRSRAYDVNNIAAKFGGGGHRAAAGCTVTGKTLSQVQNMLLKEAKNTLHKSGNNAAEK